MSTDAKQASERQADVVTLKGAKPLPTPSQPPLPDERPSPRDDAAAQLAPSNGDEAKAPLPDGEHDAAEKPAADNASHAGEQGHENFLRRHRRSFLIGTPLALILGVAGYVYWDYASHFESTDDAFVEARQFAIAPKVPGYITEVAVTDNQRVDDRQPDRPHRPARLPRRARAGGGAGRRRHRQHREHRRADRDPAGPDQRQPGAGRAGASGADFRRAAGGAL